jgi:hypothetical protein
VIGACLLVIGVVSLFLSYDGTSRLVHAVSVSCGSVISPTTTDPGSHIDCDRAGHLATAVKLMAGGVLLLAAMAFFRRTPD